LPDIDGYEVCKELRSTSPERRPYLIALSGYGQAEDVQRSLAAGFDRHLTKPVDPRVLGRLLADAN
jgi:two-component system CheB/CheR fusion protein